MLNGRTIRITRYSVPEFMPASALEKITVAELHLSCISSGETHTNLPLPGKVVRASGCGSEEQPSGNQTLPRGGFFVSGARVAPPPS